MTFKDNYVLLNFSAPTVFWLFWTASCHAVAIAAHNGKETVIAVIVCACVMAQNGHSTNINYGYMLYGFGNNLLLCYRIRALSSAYSFSCPIVDSFLIRIFGLHIPTLALTNQNDFWYVYCLHLCLPINCEIQCQRIFFGCCKCLDINLSWN